MWKSDVIKRTKRGCEDPVRKKHIQAHTFYWFKRTDITEHVVGEKGYKGEKVKWTGICDHLIWSFQNLEAGCFFLSGGMIQNGVSEPIYLNV